MTFTSTSGGAPAPTAPPFGGTPAAAPGTVQAENYDTGGQGAAYNVTAVNGSAYSYRSDGLDLEATTDSGGGYDLGWTGPGSGSSTPSTWPPPAPTPSSLRLAAPTAVTNGLHIANAAGTDLTGIITAPATGGYQDCMTVDRDDHAPGRRADPDHGPGRPGWNINYPSFATSGAAPVTGGSYGGFPAGFWGNTSSIPARQVPSSSTSSTRPTASTPTARSTGSVNGVDRVDRAVPLLRR